VVGEILLSRLLSSSRSAAGRNIELDLVRHFLRDRSKLRVEITSLLGELTFETSDVFGFGLVNNFLGVGTLADRLRLALDTGHFFELLRKSTTELAEVRVHHDVIRSRLNTRPLFFGELVELFRGFWNSVHLNGEPDAFLCY